MFLSVIKYINLDKSIDHPILGQLSCSGLEQAFRNCEDFQEGRQASVKNCKPLYTQTITCYMSKDSSDFFKKIDERIDERLKLLKFLRENQSKLPEMQQQNQQFSMMGEIDNAIKLDEDKVKKYFEQQKQENSKYL